MARRSWSIGLGSRWASAGEGNETMSAMLLQTITVAAILTLAGAYLARKLWLSLRAARAAKKGGACGGGCGCGH